MARTSPKTYIEAIEEVLKGKDGPTISNQVLIDRVKKIRPGSQESSIRAQIGEVRNKVGIPIPKRGIAAVKPAGPDKGLFAAALFLVKHKDLSKAKAVVKKVREDEAAMFAISCGGIDKAIELLEMAQTQSGDMQQLF